MPIHRLSLSRLQTPISAPIMRRTNLQWIANDTARKLSSKKRKAGLFKKVQELSILCDIKACIILYDPNNPEPEVWPSPHEAAALLHRFLSLPGYQRAHRRFDLQSSLRLRANKMIKSLEKESKAFGKPYFELLFSDCLQGNHDMEDLSIEETTALALLAEIKLTEIDAKIEASRSRQMALSARNGYFPSFLAAAPQPPPTPPAIDCRCNEEFCPAVVERRRAGLFWNEMGSYDGVYDLRRFSLMDPYSHFY